MPKRIGHEKTLYTIFPTKSFIEWYGIFRFYAGTIKKEVTMKTITSIFILFLLSNSHLLAQMEERAGTPERKAKNISSREAKRKFVFGLKAGANRSNVYNSEGMNFVAAPKNGFAGGIFACIPIGGFIGLQPEVLLSQKGFSGSGTIETDAYHLDRTTTFLDIPLQLQLKPFRFLSVVAGVQYSYLLHQDDRFIYGGNSVTQSQEFKNDNIRRNIFGAVGGIDINIRHLVLSGRTGWDMLANNGDGSSYTPRYKNVWLQGTVGYRFY